MRNRIPVVHHQGITQHEGHILRQHTRALRHFCGGSRRNIQNDRFWRAAGVIPLHIKTQFAQRNGNQNPNCDTDQKPDEQSLAHA